MLLETPPIPTLSLKLILPILHSCPDVSMRWWWNIMVHIAQHIITAILYFSQKQLPGNIARALYDSYAWLLFARRLFGGERYHGAHCTTYYYEFWLWSARSDWLASDIIRLPTNQNARLRVKILRFYVKVAYLSYVEYIFTYNSSIQTAMFLVSYEIIITWYHYFYLVCYMFFGGR